LEDKEVCRKCGGFCCKQSGGLVFPSDMGDNDLSGISLLLTENLKNGKYSVDVIFDDQNDVTGYYIRMMQVTDSGVFNPGNKGACKFLNENGCSFDYPNRPKGCRDLIPSPPSCYLSDDLSLSACVEAWKPYFAIIETVIRNSQA
jgi:Fe-S-cluster containining protein